jgi:hypothetical protein
MRIHEQLPWPRGKALHLYDRKRFAMQRSLVQIRQGALPFLLFFFFKPLSRIAPDFFALRIKTFIRNENESVCMQRGVHRSLHKIKTSRVLFCDFTTYRLQTSSDVSHKNSNPQTTPSATSGDPLYCHVTPDPCFTSASITQPTSPLHSSPCKHNKLMASAPPLRPPLRPHRTPSTPLPNNSRRRQSSRRAKTDTNVFDYLDAPHRDYEIHDATPDHVSPPPSGAKEAAPAGEGYLKALTGLLPQLWGGGGGGGDDNKDARKTGGSEGDSDPDRDRHRRRRRRRIHSYTGASPSRQALVPLPQAPPPKNTSGGILSYLPSLSIPAIQMPSLSLPAIPIPAMLKPTPEPPPQLSPEALDVVIRYLSLHTQHALTPDSPALTRRLQHSARRLMHGMSSEAASSLHAYLVVLKRMPETPVAFEREVLERYAGRDNEAVGMLMDGLGNVLRGLAQVLEGGYTAPGGWVDGRE